MDGYLAKPMRARQLYEKIDSALAGTPTGEADPGSLEPN
jgi:hypothetical protein